MGIILYECLINSEYRKGAIKYVHVINRGTKATRCRASFVKINIHKVEHTNTNDIRAQNAYPKLNGLIKRKIIDETINDRKILKFQ